MWALWLALVAGAAAEQALPWWQTAIFYQVYPRSFKDGDGDGVGDLKGITQVADYFKEIGVDAIWLSPIYKSPMADFGYDVSNYTAIDPTYGTMQDFEALAAKLRSIGVKLVLDFVPNHTSDEHPWFQHSVNPDDPLHEHYKDFYVWVDPKQTLPDGSRIPPNNWLSLFKGSAWEYRKERNKMYLHKYVIKQADLNFRNPAVRGNMTEVMKFWLDKGVDGFRMDAVQQLIEDAQLRNESVIPGTKGEVKWENLEHDYTMNQPETFSLLDEWVKVVYDRVQQDGRQRAVFLEVYDKIPITMKYYLPGNGNMAFPFNFQLLSQGSHSTRPADIKRVVDQWMTAMPEGGVANWVVGNHDNMRVSNRYGPEMVDSINLLTGVLPGIKVNYYGAEIGMTNTFVRWDQTVDPSGLLLGPDHYLEGTRDPERTPMQWDTSPNAGFSSNASTWLPINPNYWRLNVQGQREMSRSHLKVFQKLAAARRDPVLQRGDYQAIVPNDDTLVITRSYQGSSFVLIVNMGSKIHSYTSQSLFSHFSMDVDMTVVVGSVSTPYEPGTNLKGGSLNISLRPKASILLKSGSSASSSSYRPSFSVATAAIFTIFVRLCSLQ